MSLCADCLDCLVWSDNLAESSLRRLNCVDREFCKIARQTAEDKISPNIEKHRTAPRKPFIFLPSSVHRVECGSRIGLDNLALDAKVENLLRPAQNVIGDHRCAALHDSLHHGVGVIPQSNPRRKFPGGLSGVRQAERCVGANTESSCLSCQPLTEHPARNSVLFPEPEIQPVPVGTALESLDGFIHARI